MGRLLAEHISFFGFLAQRPLKIVLQDNLRGTKTFSTRYAQT